MKRIQMAVLAMAVGLSMQARATLFDVTFTGQDGSQASGELTGVATATPGVYEAISGDLNITVQGSTRFEIGTYELVPNPNAPNTAYSPSGYFIFDNQVPFVTNPGLLFKGPNGANVLIELNLYTQSSTPPYVLYDQDGRSTLGTATLTAVPEPTTIIAGALLLLPFGVSALRIVRKNQAA